MPKDAFNYFVSAWAKEGLFNPTTTVRNATEYTPIGDSDVGASHFNYPFSATQLNVISAFDPDAYGSEKGVKFEFSSPVIGLRVRYVYRGSSYDNTCVYISTTPNVTWARWEYNSAWNEWRQITSSSLYHTVTINGTTYYYDYIATYPQVTMRDSSGYYSKDPYPELVLNTCDGRYSYGTSSSTGQSSAAKSAIYALFGNSSATTTSTGGLDGTSDQPGATILTGIDDSSTPQQVADAISQQLPGLEDNRIEQTVVQPDGTVKTIVYYPVPMPNTTSQTSIGDPTTVTTKEPLQIILPNGVTITLPDGTVITGDGKTVITIPPGTYTLPSGTKIIGNPSSDPTNPDGSTQDDPSISNESSSDLLRYLVNTLVNPSPQPMPDPNVDTEANPEPAPDPNPSDTGDGVSPVIIPPTGSASALFTVYNPTQAQLDAFGAWLWSNNFIDQIAKLFSDPMQAIIGLHKTFIQPNVGSATTIKAGYIDSGVSSATIPTQYTTVDCGTVSLPEYFGNVFDYSPYTRVFIYLPFIGFKELDISQVMRSSINVKYHGDAYTGTGLCEVIVKRDGGAGGTLYTYGCECAVRYPLSQGSYMGMVSSIIGLGLGAAGIATGNIGMAVGGMSRVLSGGAKVELSGGFSGNSGAMGIKKPYLVIMRPQTAMPNRYYHFSGSPSSTTTKIKNCSGLIRVRECHVESLPYATKEEKDIIESALHSGVIVS